MIISFVYVAYIGMSDGIWVIMTCAIILFDNPTLGGTINKSHLRFWGTFFAAAFSLIFIVGFANNVIINLLGVVIGTFLAAYWYMDTAQGYIGGLISWTLPIILLNNNDIKSAFLRLMNIIIGIIVSYIMLRYFYPEYARDNMLKSMHKTLVELPPYVTVVGDAEKPVSVHAACACEIDTPKVSVSAARAVIINLFIKIYVISIKYRLITL
jgi:uncharacterized membrane protein YccC